MPSRSISTDLPIDPYIFTLPPYPSAFPYIKAQHRDRRRKTIEKSADSDDIALVLPSEPTETDEDRKKEERKERRRPRHGKRSMMIFHAYHMLYQWMEASLPAVVQLRLLLATFIVVLYKFFFSLLLRIGRYIEMPGQGPNEAVHLRSAAPSSLLCQLQFPTARIRIGRVRAAQEIEIAFTGKNRSVRSLSSFDTTHRCRRLAPPHPLSCGRSLLLVFKSNMS